MKDCFFKASTVLLRTTKREKPIVQSSKTIYVREAVVKFYLHERPGLKDNVLLPNFLLVLFFEFKVQWVS